MTKRRSDGGWREQATEGGMDSANADREGERGQGIGGLCRAWFIEVRPTQAQGSLVFFQVDRRYCAKPL